MDNTSLNDTVESLEHFIDSQYQEITSTPIQRSDDTEAVQEAPVVPNVNMGNPQPVESKSDQSAVIVPETAGLISRLHKTLSQVSQVDDGQAKGKKRKFNKSPIKTLSSQQLSGEQIDIAEGVFESLVAIMSEYLDDFRGKLSQEFEIAIQRHRDDIDAACNAQVAEIQMLNDELKVTKEECIIAEGRLTRAEKQIEDLREQLLHQEARSMRDNLVFHNVPEVTSASASNPENTEATLRSFMKKEMKINDAEMNNIKFDRVHRTGPKQQGRSRLIIAKFNPSRGKDTVLKHAKNLDKNKRFGVNEQLPRELEERKKQLIPKYREARSKQLRPKWSLDKLVVGSTVTQIERDRVKDINSNTTKIATSMKVKRFPPKTYNKNSFQGQATDISCQDDIIPALHAIYSDSRVARATHNVYAYRIKVGNDFIEHYEDDGEHGAGHVLLKLLRERNVSNKFVCVSRWSGGTHLGRARFDHITEAATLALEAD